ncbi:hypothetical protein AGMMS50222_05830 [Endomicrobiia bacterium]|nr:hypothetical protein AGMMS49531_10460 [Endomicrobiia bacterium]GHT65816.1 hypothetical protein AGMMS49556_06130 [Endomicrobiia bacterium]GHT75233.1 hypothetical protein AGMMS50222_05830 [Endomicrobiia bacterium]
MKRTIGLAAMLMIGLIISSCISSTDTNDAELADRRDITPNKFVAVTPPVPETVIEPTVEKQGTEKLLPKLPSTEKPEPAKEKGQREKKSRKSRGGKERKSRGVKERKSRKSKREKKKEQRKSKKKRLESI